MSASLQDAATAAGTSAGPPAVVTIHPELLAQQLFKRHPTLTTPLPMAMLAAKEGAHIRYSCILAHGGLARTAAGYVITINDTLNTYRKRFTIAHELGHLLLDRDYGGDNHSHACIVPEFPSRDTTERFDEERFCDAFASALLLPDARCTDLCDWNTLSIPALVRRARTLRVSPITLAWRVLSLAPHENAGILMFRPMGKPTKPHDVKLRLDWGYFPKAKGPQQRGVYLPRYDKVPEGSPIHRALGCRTQLHLSQVKLDFGSLRGYRSLLIAEIGKPGEDRLMAIVLPSDAEASTTRAPCGDSKPQADDAVMAGPDRFMQLELFNLPAESIDCCSSAQPNEPASHDE